MKTFQEKNRFKVIILSILIAIGLLLVSIYKANSQTIAYGIGVSSEGKTMKSFVFKDLKINKEMSVGCYVVWNNDNLMFVEDCSSIGLVGVAKSETVVGFMFGGNYIKFLMEYGWNETIEHYNDAQINRYYNIYKDKTYGMGFNINLLPYNCSKLGLSITSTMDNFLGLKTILNVEYKFNQ